jgi:hypothetical protein
VVKKGADNNGRVVSVNACLWEFFTIFQREQKVIKSRQLPPSAFGLLLLRVKKAVRSQYGSRSTQYAAVKGIKL